MDFSEVIPTYSTRLGPILICPSCGDPHVWPVRTIAEDESDKSLRYITLQFACSQDHTWDLTATVDHGVTYIDIANLRQEA